MRGFCFILSDMSNKKSKKRTKQYQGEDAKRTNVVPSEPVVHRYEAVERSRVGEWWQAKKKVIRLGAIVAGIGAGATWLIVELFRLIF